MDSTNECDQSFQLRVRALKAWIEETKDSSLIIDRLQEMIDSDNRGDCFLALLFVPLHNTPAILNSVKSIINQTERHNPRNPIETAALYALTTADAKNAAVHLSDAIEHGKTDSAKLWNRVVVRSALRASKDEALRFCNEIYSDESLEYLRYDVDFVRSCFGDRSVLDALRQNLEQSDRSSTTYLESLLALAVNKDKVASEEFKRVIRMPDLKDRLSFLAMSAFQLAPEDDVNAETLLNALECKLDEVDE